MTHSPQPPTTGDIDPAPAGRRRSTRTMLTLAVAGAVVAAVMTLGVGVIVAERSSAPATFVTQPGFQPGTTPPCLMHQTDTPNGAYQGGADSRSLPQLTFLAYYTAVGQKPFCDGQPATDTDEAWAKLYVQLTSNPDKVSSVLG